MKKNNMEAHLEKQQRRKKIQLKNDNNDGKKHDKEGENSVTNTKMKQKLRIHSLKMKLHG